MPFGFSAGPVQIATCNFPPRSCDLFTLPPHAPCRLQRFLCRNFLFQPPLPPHAPCRLQPGGASGARNAGALPPHAPCRLQRFSPGAAPPPNPLPPHAPCRLQRRRLRRKGGKLIFASTRSVQIATRRSQASPRRDKASLPPHAPCRLQPSCDKAQYRDFCPLPPHAPCRLQLDAYKQQVETENFASTRSVQIATQTDHFAEIHYCFASTRSVQIATTAVRHFYDVVHFASTRSVQIATGAPPAIVVCGGLCLHTLRADCNCRNAQNAICTF